MLCLLCFQEHSRTSGASSAGNKGGNPGNAGPTKTGVHKRPAGNPSRCVRDLEELWGRTIVDKDSKRDTTAAEVVGNEPPTKRAALVSR